MKCTEEQLQIICCDHQDDVNVMLLVREVRELRQELHDVRNTYGRLVNTQEVEILRLKERLK